MNAAIDRPEAEFLAHLAAGRFMIQRARGSGRHVFPPRLAEPGSGARDLEWVEATGLGTVHAVTIVHPRPPLTPYNVVLVDLAEGPRLLARVDGVAPEAVTIGLAVRARIAQGEEGHFVVFDPVSVGSAHG